MFLWLLNRPIGRLVAESSRGYNMHVRRVYLVPLLAIVIVGAALIGYHMVLAGRAVAPPPRYHTAMVKTGTITIKVNANGAVAMPAQVAVTGTYSATLTELTVAPGQQVQARQKLGTLDTNGLDSAVAQAKLALASAQARLDAVKGGPRSETVAQALAAVNQARATLRSDQARLQALEAGPRPELVAQAQATLGKAKAALAADTAQASGNMAAAEATLADAQAKLQAAQQSAPYLIAQVRANVQSAKYTLFAAQATRDGKCVGPWAAPPYQCQAASAQANAAAQSLTSAETKLAQQEVQNKATIAAAQAAVDQASATLQQVRAAQAASSARDKAAVSAAQASLSLAEHPYTAADIEQARATVARDAASLAAAAAGLSLAQHPYVAADLRQVEAAVAQAQASLLAAEARRQSALLLSPISGTVLSVPAAAGSYLSAGAPVATIAQTGAATITANVSEFDMRRVAPHDPATVKLDGLPGKKLHGTVTDVSVMPLTVQGVVFYPVTIAVQNPKHLPLRPGMTGRATIVTDTRRNVLVLPNEAILQWHGSEAVLVSTAGGSPAWKPVQVGASDGHLTEIQSGLKVGDTVLIPAAGIPPAGVTAPSAGATAGSAPPGIGVPPASDQGQH